MLFVADHRRQPALYGGVRACAPRFAADRPGARSRCIGRLLPCGGLPSWYEQRFDTSRQPSCYLLSSWLGAARDYLSLVSWLDSCSWFVSRSLFPLLFSSPSPSSCVRRRVQVKDKDGRLLRAKELLTTKLASKNKELEAAQVGGWRSSFVCVCVCVFSYLASTTLTV